MKNILESIKMTDILVNLLANLSLDDLYMLRELIDNEIDHRELSSYADGFTNVANIMQPSRNEAIQYLGETSGFYLPNVLVVGNIGQANASDLYPRLSDYGHILKIEIPTNPQTYEPASYAYVATENSEDAKSIIDNLNGHNLYGKRLNIYRLSR